MVREKRVRGGKKQIRKERRIEKKRKETSSLQVVGMLFSLCVSKVISFVVMQGKTQFALIRPQMITKEIRILGKI